MGKDKLRRFAENLTFRHLVQPPLEKIIQENHPLKGNWNQTIFGTDKPLILELGCGKGEYTIGLSRAYPDKNFIGVDIKGARLWRGAKTIQDEKITNAAFLRTRIEFISSFFNPGEVNEIWITFPDPQLKERRAKKRLTAPGFLLQYQKFLAPNGCVHLKTDSSELYQFTLGVLKKNNLEILWQSEDIYSELQHLPNLSIKTYYENRFIEQGKKITYIQFKLNSAERYFFPENI